MNNVLPSELFYTSIALFIGTLFYLRTQTQVTKIIYKYVGYILLSGIIIYVIEFSFAYWLGYNQYFYSYFVFIFIFIYIVTCFAGITYAFRKHFQDATWFPRALFALFTISLYYIPTLFGMLFTIIIYDLQ